MFLYLPEKYKVYKGTSRQIGLVTCWNDPEIFLKKYKDFNNYFGLMGSLYSREGVSIIIRNLALNPSINKLILYGANPLSNTEFGKAGREMLEMLWKKGIGNDSLVNGTNFSLHKEIEVGTVMKIISSVELINLSKLSIEELYLRLQNFSKESSSAEYMDSISFPETLRKSDITFPSEKVGFSFHGESVYEAWLKVLEGIIRYGDLKKNPGRSDVKELQLVTWTISGEDLSQKYIPEIDKEILDIIGLNEDFIDTYFDIFINPDNKKGSEYTYGQRLRSYQGDNDQVLNMIRLINEDKFTRRAVATTIIPDVDGTNLNPPCLVFVQALVDTNSKINIFVTFRSHDIFKAAIPNAFGVLKLQEFICQKTNLEKGSITLISTSAHIYEEDFENAKKLLECQMWGEIKTKFDENTDLDPRGVVKISVRNNEICSVLMDLEGNELVELVGKSAKEVGYKIARLSLLSRKEHFIDIMNELSKAEISLKSGLEYKQDRMINIDGKLIIY